MLTRLHPQPADREAGVSLTDLLVSVVLMGLLLSMCVTAVVSGTRTTKQVGDRTVALTGLEQAVQRSARHLRAANLLFTADGTGFTSRETRNGVTWVVSLTTPVVAGRQQLLYRARPCPAPCTTVPDLSAPAERAVWIDGLLPATTHPGGAWFRYSFQSGSTVTSSATTLSAAERELVFSADVALRRTVPGLQPVESSTVVALRNSVTSTDPVT